MTRTRTTTARSAVTLTGADFHRLIRSVLPCAATDGVLPALNAVHLETTGRGLYAAATDRYAVAVARHTNPDPGRPHAQATVPRAAVAVMLRLVRRGPDLVAVHIGADSSATVTTASGATYRIPAADRHASGFPDWRKLFAKLLTRAPVPGGQPVNLNPAYLARFKAASDGNPGGLRTRLHQTGHSTPVLVVSAGEWFLGALMSIRPTDHTATADPYTAWETDLTPAAAAAA